MRNLIALGTKGKGGDVCVGGSSDASRGSSVHVLLFFPLYITSSASYLSRDPSTFVQRIRLSKACNTLNRPLNRSLNSRPTQTEALSY
jgi:hypothetical protein